MSLFRKTVLKLDEPSGEPYAPLFEALQNFLDFLTTHEVSYNMVISAGLIEHLRKIISNRQRSRSVVVARTIPLLENALYGPPQGTSMNQRNNSPFTTFMSENGIQFLLDRIKVSLELEPTEQSRLILFTFSSRSTPILQNIKADRSMGGRHSDMARFQRRRSMY